MTTSARRDAPARFKIPGFVQILLAGLASVVFAGLLAPVAAHAAPAPVDPAGGTVLVEASQPIYETTIENGWLEMKDGVRLSVTYVRPHPRSEGETFPVLFDLYPYRKDDYPSGPPLYFASRGYITATVDIRGTGSSEGKVPPREYSEQEMQDAIEVIDQLSKIPGSNGNVGMHGKSWGGFNSIQVAMRRPPALKAILPVEATDDLFHDDVHHMDGAFHLDQFIPQMTLDNILPQVPGYELDDDYFRNRFNNEPWFLNYSRHQKDGPFWRKGSLRWQYDTINIPILMIGGLLDGYRDSIPRMLEKMSVPMKASIGPYKHDYPNDGVPGPNFEWRHEAIRFWDRWLKERRTGIMDEPRLDLFIREGHPPDRKLKITPGHWISTAWPVPGTTWKTHYPAGDHALTTRAGPKAVKSLRYVPSHGIATGLWWGEPTGDMRPDDAGSLVFDGPLLEERFMIAGMPKVHLRVSADAPLAHWVARLEDVQPDGSVSLVAGELLNGSQRNSRLEPELLVPGKVYDLEFDMHFTTWTFKPGHRIRLSVSNALFPMIWPTPYRMTTQFHVGVEATRVELPVIPDVEYATPSYRPPETSAPSAEGRYLEGVSWPDGHYVWTRDLVDDRASLEWKGHGVYLMRDERHHKWERNYYETSDSDPADSRFEGEAGRRIELEGRILEFRATVDVQSDEKNFHITIVRTVKENGEIVRTREWKESIPRMFN
jgi:predicted acyl esterase